MKTKEPPLTDAKCATGVPGLDRVIGGGLPRRRIYLVEGAPGSGKTTLALQFLLNGAKAGEKVLYISLSETRDEVEEVARSHGWSLDNVEIVELAAIDEQLALESQNTLFHPSEVELSQTTRLLLEAVGRAGPSRVAFDSLSELRLLSQTSLRYRRQLLAFKQFLAGKNCTSLLLDDGTANSDGAHVQSLAHGVICLEQLSPEVGAQRRRLLVKKIRGTTYLGGYNDFVIERGGLRIFPRLVAAEHHRKFPNENLSSGVKGLDDLLGGGLSRGTATLLTGPPGSGKSNLALTFAVAAARRGERVSIYTFDESLPILFARARGLGFGLDDLVDKGVMKIVQIDPAELSPGELSCRIQSDVESWNARVVYLDSLNGYLHAMGEQRYVNLHLHELLTFLNQQGVVTMMVVSPHGLTGHMQSILDITYLADTVITLRFFEAGGAVHKALSVIKKRTGPHETTIRELTIEGDGVRVGPALTAFRGVLTGVPVLVKKQPRPKTRRAHGKG